MMQLVLSLCRSKGVCGLPLLARVWAQVWTLVMFFTDFFFVFFFFLGGGGVLEFLVV